MTRLLTATILSLTLLTSCFNAIEGVGESKSEDRAMEKFDQVVLETSADVNIRHNLIKENNSIEVIAQENILPLVTTVVKGGVLTIDVKESIMTTDKFEVNINTNGLTSIASNGSGDVSSDNVLRFEDMDIEHNGSGDVTLKLKGEELDVNHNGSGDISLDGSVDEFDLESNGSGDVDAFDLVTKKADVGNNGSGDINVHVKESLDVTNNGSGDVRYKGKPGEIEQTKNGSGSIKDAN